MTNEFQLRQLSEDRALASEILFSHRHRQMTPLFHVQMMDAWRAADELIVIKAFRGGAKTTKSEEFNLMEACFHNFEYLLIFGETYTKACQRIEAMKHEIMTNMKIKSLFGNMHKAGLPWSENRIVLSNGVCIEAHGWEEEIRGFIYLGKRPDRVHLDDIENEERVRDTATVNDNWRKMYMQLLPAMDPELGRLRMTGTPLADDCMINRAAKSSHWVNCDFPICDRDIDDPLAQSAWPDRFPMEKIREIRDRMSQAGMLREFRQEYLLIATGAQGKPFTKDMLRFEDVAPTMYSPKVAIIDPARTTDIKKSDQSGRVVVSRIGSKIYVHESGGEYWKPDDIVSNAFNISQKYDDCPVAIEKNSLDEWLLQPIRSETMRRNQALDVKVLQAPQDKNKDQFIMGLQPFFKAGDIILVGGQSAHQQLVAQIENFPAGKKDILNALAYAPKVFSGVPVYEDFSQHNHCENYVLGRNATLLLAANATGTETTAALCALDGSYLTCIADWISPLIATDVVPDIVKLIKAAYPGRKVTAWVPADIVDQVGRNQLVTALKSCGFKANRSEYASISRGSLSSMIRTEMRGRRMFQVDANARNTLRAMSLNYCWPIKSGGERGAEPERGPAKTLIEAIESLTYAINRPNNDTISTATNAVNALGTPYLSALPRR